MTAFHAMAFHSMVGRCGRRVCATLVLSVPVLLHAQCMPDAYLSISTPALDQRAPITSPMDTAQKEGNRPSSAHHATAGVASRSVSAPAADARWVTISEAQVRALPLKVIVTETDWTPASRFEGPLLRDVLKLGGGGDLRESVSHSTLMISALNQYAVSIPVSDLEKYEPILALSRDGVQLQRSDFGPMFIVYPRDAFPELRQPTMASRMAWQVCRIDVR